MDEKELLNIGTKDKFNEIVEKLNLTYRQKQIFVLKYGCGMMNVDIAEEIGYCSKVVSSELKIIRHKMSQL